MPLQAAYVAAVIASVFIASVAFFESFALVVVLVHSDHPVYDMLARDV